MKEVAVYEAKTRLSELLAEVERGEQVTITRRGQPIARLVGVADTTRAAAVGQRESVAATLGAMKRNRKGVVLEGRIGELIAEARD